MLDLEAIEQIKQLKARYFRGMDICDVDLLKTLFTEDCQVYFLSSTYEITLNGWAEAEEFYRNNWSPTRVAMHHGHTPEITVDGDTATGYWYLSDFVVNQDKGFFLTGSAIYEDTYVKQNGVWLMSRTGYERRLEVREPIGDRVVVNRPIMAYER